MDIFLLQRKARCFQSCFLLYIYPFLSWDRTDKLLNQLHLQHYIFAFNLHFTRHTSSIPLLVRVFYILVCVFSYPKFPEWKHMCSLSLSVIMFCIVICMQCIYPAAPYALPCVILCSFREKLDWLKTKYLTITCGIKSFCLYTFFGTHIRVCFCEWCQIIPFFYRQIRETYVTRLCEWRCVCVCDICAI